MPVRNGLKAFARGAHYLCRLYATWSASMFAAVDAHPTLTEGEKTAVKAALTAVNATCATLELVMVIYE